MKKLLSIKYSASAFNTALFILRVGAGVLLAAHGYDKLIHFQQFSSKFINFMGIGQSASLSLAIFAEFFCSIFVILGLFTRIAAIPILINMAVAIGKAHNYDFFGDAEKPTLFFLIFLTILIVGPGKASVDGMINK
ncbi:MAG: DoxX family protein [Chitinophagaceae bacterium]|nr:DoxX family protein [Chitinophagaceae bacterium]